MVTVNNAFRAFLRSRKLSGCSDPTIIGYRDTISLYIRTLASDTLDSFTIESYQEFFLGLYAKNLSKATVASYIRRIKIFLRWVQEEYGLELKAEKIKVPKSPKKNPHIYTDSELKQIFQCVYSGGGWLDLRNCALIALMLDSGLRQNETCLLRWRDVDLQRKMMKVYGKGDKERFVPVGSISLQYIQKYRDACPYKNKLYVFCTKDGSQLTRNAVKLFMYKIASQLPFEFSSHKLRHNFATNFLVDQYTRNGSMDIYALLAIMGHEDVATTQRYLHIANQLIYSRAHISHLDSVLGMIPTNQI